MIRRAHPGDLRRVAELAHAAFAPYLPRTGTPPAPMTMDYGPAVADGLVDLWVEADALAGMLLLRDEPDHLLLDVVAVDPAFRGRGIGGALLAHAEAEARRRDRVEIRLYTHAAMTEAQAIYLRHGYAETGRATTDGRPRVFYSKRVG